MPADYPTAAQRIYHAACQAAARRHSAEETMLTLTLKDFQEVRARIAQHIKHTPLLTSRQLSERSGFDVRMKAEMFQRVGSYKIRGPLNKFALMPEEQKKRGVVCSSAGNHAQYGIDSSYDATVNIMGRAMSNHVEMRSEVWVTGKLPVELMTFVQMRGFKKGIDEVDRVMESQAGAIKGFPLKQVMTSTTTSSRGGSRTWTTTTTITDVKEEPIPTAQFDVPAGYTRTDMPRAVREQRKRDLKSPLWPPTPRRRDRPSR